MNLEDNTAKTLRYSVFVGIGLMVIGLIFHFLEITDDVLWAGILFLILSPLFGVIVSTVSLWIEKDTKWVAVAVILIAISVIGICLK